MKEEKLFMSAKPYFWDYERTWGLVLWWKIGPFQLANSGCFSFRLDESFSTGSIKTHEICSCTDGTTHFQLDNHGCLTCQQMCTMFDGCAKAHEVSVVLRVYDILTIGQIRMLFMSAKLYQFLLGVQKAWVLVLFWWKTTPFQLANFLD